MNSVKFMNDFEVKGLKEVSKSEMKEIEGGAFVFCAVGWVVAVGVAATAWTVGQIAGAFGADGAADAAQGVANGAWVASGVLAVGSVIWPK